MPYADPEKQKAYDRSRWRDPELRKKWVIKSRAWAKANPERKNAIARKSHLKRYGLTENDYQRLLIKQKGLCAICYAARTETRLAIDHDHSCCPQRKTSCGKCVRWLLCGKCNLLLGAANDSVELLRKAARMLSRWKTKQENKHGRHAGDTGFEN